MIRPVFWKACADLPEGHESGGGGVNADVAGPGDCSGGGKV